MPELNLHVMARFLNVFLSAYVVIVSLGAQNIYMNIPGYNDTITKQLFPYINPDAGGQNIVWDFTDLSDGKGYVVCNTRIDKADTSTFVSDEHATRYYFKEEAGVLYCSGYENTTSHIHYDSLELYLNTLLQYGDTLSRHFSGSGEYAHRLPFTIEGNVFMKVDGEGILLLPEETISPVIRVFKNRRHMKIMSDTISLSTQTWQWFTPACRYPIMEIMRTLTNEDSVLFSAALVFSPRQQKEQNLPVKEYYLENNSRSIFTNASFLPNPVTSKLVVTYTLEAPASIAFLLHYQGGVLMYRSNAIAQSEGVYHHEIPMSGMPTGAYTLYIHVNDILISEPIIKQ